VEFDAPVTKAQLTKIPNVSKVEALEKGWLIESVSPEDLRKSLAQYAQTQNWLILTLNIEQKSLEEVFKELTK
jgi:ABC-2 type transport system ATP-binding protein